MKSTMFHACSSGAPLPPNGGDASYLTPAVPRPSSHVPSAPLCLAVWCLYRSLGLPPISCIIAVD